MTINDAITRIDALKPNSYTSAEKVAWLSELDHMVRNLIIDVHEDAPEEPFTGYVLAGDTPAQDATLATDLIVDEPFDEIYLSWLESKIDYYNRETISYNNTITRFNDTFSAYSNWYNRNHMPLGRRIVYY